MGNGSVATMEQNYSGLVDLTGSMSGGMAARLNEMKCKLDLVREFMDKVMVEGFDYGVIPGTGNKLMLLKPGAEKLCELYGFAHLIKDKHTDRDLETGYFLAEVVVQIVHRNTGLIIAEGVGECSSFESKYRYRWLFDSDLTRMRIDPKGLVSKVFVKPNNEEYTKYRMDNPDLMDQWNTVLKMAKKRALVDAVLAATRSSELFSRTQTEMDAWMEEGETPKDDHPVQKKSSPATADPSFTMRGETKKLSEWDTSALTWIAYKSQAREAVKAAAQTILNSRAQSSSKPNEAKNDFQGEEAPPPSDEDAPSGLGDGAK